MSLGLILIGACSSSPNNDDVLGPVGVLGGSGLRPAITNVVVSVGEEKGLLPWLRLPDGSIPISGVEWKTSDPAVATIEPQSGLIKGIAKGTSVITAVISGRGQAQFTVDVTEKKLVDSLFVTPSNSFLVVGEHLPLTAEVHLADGQVNANVNWFSSDNTVAMVNPVTGVVQALKVGRVTVVASYSLDPRYKGMAELVIVKSKEEIPMPSASPLALQPILGQTPRPVGAAPVFTPSSDIAFTPTPELSTSTMTPTPILPAVPTPTSPPSTPKPTSPVPTPRHYAPGDPDIPGTIDQENTLVGDTASSSGGSTRFGQTFVPSRSGAISALAVWLSSSFGGDATLTIYSAGEDGFPIDPPLGSSVIPGRRIPSNSPEGLSESPAIARFDSPVPVLPGKVYAWVFSHSGYGQYPFVRGTIGDSYLRGEGISFVYDWRPTSGTLDFNFRVYMQ